MAFATAIKTILWSSIIHELILQLTEFKNHLKNADFCLFIGVFGKLSKKGK